MTTYRELIVKGHSSVLKGFIWGFMSTRKIKKGLVICNDHPIRSRQIKDLLKYHGDVVHVITSLKVNEILVAAIKQAPKHLEFKIVSNRRIKETRFEFRYETYNRDVAAGLKRTLARLPVSLELVDHKPKERVDPGAAGSELYSPVHDYEFKGEGKVRGDIESLLRLHTKLKEHAFIEVEDIVIVQ